MKKQQDDATTNIIYQYYSLNTFYSVIKNTELWFSDAKKMNDTKEDEQVFSILKSELIKIVKEIKKEEIEIKENQEKEKFLKEIENEIVNKNKEYKRHFNEIKKYSIKKDSKKLTELKKRKIKILTILFFNLFKTKNKFISCFSKEGDLLSQWRSYADNGRGICIGFNVDILKTILNKELDKKNYSIDDIMYLKETENNTKNIDEIIEKFYKNRKLLEIVAENVDLDELWDPLFNLDENISKYIFESNIFEVILERALENDEDFTGLRDIFEDITSSIFFKNYGFFEEQEVRILIKKKNDKEDKNKDSIKIFKNKFRINKNNNDLIEYIILSFNKDLFKAIISEIIIGPNNNIEKEDLENYLKSFDILENITIKKSEISYKN